MENETAKSGENPSDKIASTLTQNFRSSMLLLMIADTAIENIAKDLKSSNPEKFYAVKSAAKDFIEMAEREVPKIKAALEKA